ncbi:ABC transporter permease [Metallosphaera tengchongensis]|uniref:ABC transporter permease n=1 Tax=Metallosphaera tengchongensis TaxID=1532350 RepID=A0A6N0NUF9_9CREN|nr:ABC transporter permease [Metallosphaera tengchongensis]QKR00362.1 ABC transporter permease [Metallosphaera tengchongensis]
MRKALITALAIIKDNLSSRTTLFFVIFFPLFLTLIFALGFGSAAQPHVTVVVQGNSSLAHFLDSSSLFTGTTGMGMREALLHNYIFAQVNGDKVYLYYPQDDSYLIPSLEALVQEFFSGNKAVTFQNLPQEGFSYYGYVISGMIGVVSLSNGLFGITGVAAGYYRDRLVDRLAASPLRSYEWVMGLIIYEIVITLISIVPILLLGIAFGFLPLISLSFIVFLIISTLMFAGLGSVIFGLSPKDKLFVAQTAANILVFPLMFLSNAFFQIEAFPTVLRPLVAYQPLSIINDVIRDLVVYNTLPSFAQVVYIGVATVAFVYAGGKLMKLRETD